MVRRPSDLQHSYDVASPEIETNRPVGEALGEAQRGGVRYRWLVKCHRPAAYNDVAYP